MKGYSTHAEAAKAIRAELKPKFPKVKFIVRSESFAGGNAVSIEWFDGPTTAQVDAIIGIFRYGSVDLISDIYVSDNRDESIPQVKYVQTHRNISFDTAVKVAEKIKKERGFQVILSKTEENGYRIGNAFQELFDNFPGQNYGDPIRVYAQEMSF